MKDLKDKINESLINEDKWDDANNKASKHMFDVLDEYIDYKSEKENDWGYISFETSIKKSDIKDIAILFVNGSKDIPNYKDTGLDWSEVDYKEHDNPCIYVNQFKMPLLNIRENGDKFILTIKNACAKYYIKNIKK
jgi:hypothetical protein